MRKADPSSTKVKKRPSLLRDLLGLFLGGCVITFIFWLGLGEGAVPVAISLSIFLALLVLAVRHGESLYGKVKAPHYTPRTYDLLGVVWLLAFPFGPFFGWSATEQLTAGNWQTVAGIRAFLCVALPLIGVLPLLRFIPGPRALAKALILLIGTAFPVVQGLTATFDLAYGPIWQNVDVVAIRSIDFLFHGRRIKSTIRFVDLSDGRTLRTVEESDKAVRRGPMQLLVLRGLGRILAAR